MLKSLSALSARGIAVIFLFLTIFNFFIGVKVAQTMVDEIIIKSAIQDYNTLPRKSIKASELIQLEFNKLEKMQKSKNCIENFMSNSTCFIWFPIGVLFGITPIIIWSSIVSELIKLIKFNSRKKIIRI